MFTLCRGDKQEAVEFGSVYVLPLTIGMHDGNDEITAAICIV